jgi:hypothetical protein
MIDWNLGEIEDFIDNLAQLDKEVERLQAEVERLRAKLPATEDGKVVGPNDDVWLVYKSAGGRRVVIPGGWEDALVCAGMVDEPKPSHWIGCYSTRQAAVVTKEDDDATQLR